MSNPDRKIYVPDEAGMVSLAAAWAPAFVTGGVVYLQGDLGAGKTTFSRGLIQALGHTGTVKSPTYTLVESYVLAACTVYHFDLYRLIDPEELDHLGIRDYLTAGALLLVEWPQRGAGYLPAPDLVVEIALSLPGRELQLSARTPKGERLRDRLMLIEACK